MNHRGEWLSPLGQGLCCCLSLNILFAFQGVQPLSDSEEWSDQAKKRFEELVSWKMLVGSVDGEQYKYDFREEHKVPMNLFDTSDNDKDISIAEVLMNEGLARRT